MKLPRSVDGDAFAKHLIRKWEYHFVRQAGSHIRVRTASPREHSTTIPSHKPMKTGMFAALVKEISTHKGVSPEELLAGL